VRPIIAEWRKSKGLPEDPMKAFRESGYLERVTRERRDRHTGTTASYA
jgi:L-rhamnose isomerase / sugar isomerase